jgi:hypothetical protein
MIGGVALDCFQPFECLCRYICPKIHRNTSLVLGRNLFVNILQLGVSVAG